MTANRMPDCLQLLRRIIRCGLSRWFAANALRQMRMGFFVLALALGCFGCHDKSTNGGQTVSMVPASEAGEWPSFYDSNNFAEYYGRCPKCRQWVKGYVSNTLYKDERGKAVDCRPTLMGMCEHCRVWLFGNESETFTNESRFITWKPPVARDETPWLDGNIGIVATNVSLFGVPGD